MNRDYRPYCAMCYYHLHPDAPQRRNYLTKQKHLYGYIQREIDRPFRYDQAVDNGCSQRRPDFMFDCGTHTVHVENDANRHVGSQCEDKRTMELFQDLGSRPLVQLRFNPDAYTDERGNRVTGCFSFDDANKLVVDDTEWQRRWSVLKTALNAALVTLPEKELTVTYLFYHA